MIHEVTKIAHGGWLLVLTAFALLAISVLLLARMQRIQTRPLRVCFFLAIFAHILLLAVFYLSRILDMPYLPGSHHGLIVQLTWDDENGQQFVAAEVDIEDSADAVGHNSTSEPPPVPTMSPMLPDDDGESPLPSLKHDDALQDSEQTVDGGNSVHDDNPSTPVEVDTLAEARPETGVAEPSRDMAEAEPRFSEEPANTPVSPASEPFTRLDGVVSSAVDETKLAPSDDTQLTTDEAALDHHSEPANNSNDHIAAHRETGGGDWKVVQPQRELPMRYRDRVRRPSEQEMQRRGGSPIAEAAVDAALLWLARNQEPDGRWDPVRHGAGRGGWIEGQDRGDTGLHADTGISALALLSFLGAGHTHQFGSHADTVRSALDYLVAQQAPTGNLGGAAGLYAQMYCHGMATLALCEALAMTNDQTLRPAAQRAIGYTLACQHRGTGGWRYRPGESGDTSQFGWQLLSIVAAREAQLDVPSNVEDSLRQFLSLVQCGRAGGLAAYRPGFGPTHAMTAEALACRNLLGISEQAATREAVDYLLGLKPGTGPNNFYYWYYAALALSQLNDENWLIWNRAMQRELLSCQRRQGPLAGSWDPVTVWGPVGGRVYTTAMATLCLESYYRYARDLSPNDFAPPPPSSGERAGVRGSSSIGIGSK